MIRATARDTAPADGSFACLPHVFRDAEVLSVSEVPAGLWPGNPLPVSGVLPEALCLGRGPVTVLSSDELRQEPHVTLGCPFRDDYGTQSTPRAEGPRLAPDALFSSQKSRKKTLILLTSIQCWVS